MIGQTISHYRIIEKLGEGGMGVVYLAEDQRLRRTVALKFLPADQNLNQSARDRFEHEAVAASALDHPNICTIYEIDETEDGRTFIAMARYDGETLKQWIARGAASIDEALDVTIQIAEGLRAAHRAGIVHRDIKPGNIIVTADGRVKVLDFGLAKRQDVKLTMTGTTLGTTAYMSPEQVRGDKVDQRTDIWSLGVLLFELLTGERPFRGDYEHAVVYAILNEDPISLSEGRSEIPEAIDRIIARALAKDPEKRYGSMDQFLADLLELREASRTSARSSATGNSGTRFGQGPASDADGVRAGESGDLIGVDHRLSAALQDRYHIERKLGEGGMAAVYLAQDLKHRRRVAVKVLKQKLTAVVGAERFLAEIETTAGLVHPNILPLFDSGESDGFLFYVMPYAKGESLRERLDRERQLPVDEAVRIAGEIAEALGAAHEQGVVHRDIKPANIMLSKGRPLLADFGIALAFRAAGGDRLTETGLSIGTPHYMSPEQATGDQAVGPASDIYSLGCVLYEMLVGEPPYTGKTAQAILGKVITSEPSSVTQQRKAIPANVDATVSRALEKIPADRFATAGDFAAALKDEHFRHGPFVSGGAPAARTIRLLAIAGWVATAVMAVLVAVVALSPDPPLPVKRLSLSTAGIQGPTEWLSLSPDGSALVIAQDRVLGNGPLVIRRFDDRSTTVIPGTDDAVDPIVSPDGESVAFGSPNGLFVVPMAGGSLRTLVEEGLTCCIRWGTDGYVYYSSYAEEFWQIYRVRSAGGEPELVIAADADKYEGLLYYEPLPGGKRALLGSVSDSGRVELLDTGSGDRAVLTTGLRPFYTSSGHVVFTRGSGNLYAAALDEASMRLRGSPVLLEENVGFMSRDAMVTLSASGDLVYWMSPAGADIVRELVWVSRFGESTAVDLTWTGEFESVSLSPDGSRAAVTVGTILDTEIWLKELDDGPSRRLTNVSGMNRRAVWSPDGRSVAFISDRGGRRAAYTVEVDGIGSPKLLVEHPNKDVDELQWTPDGNWLIYRTGTGQGGRDIYARRIRPDTATVAVSVQPNVDEVAPAISPDGRWLAYVSDETGQQEIWVRPFPDFGRGQRQVSINGGREPVWARDGSELYFRSPSGLMAVEVGLGEEFSTGAYRRLFPSTEFHSQPVNRSFDSDADGERFLMIRRVQHSGSGAELIYVQNFIEEVKARVGD